MIAEAEGKLTEKGTEHKTDRDWILDTFTECLAAVDGLRVEDGEEDADEDGDGDEDKEETELDDPDGTESAEEKADETTAKPAV